jgi:hypothetical protein
VKYLKEERILKILEDDYQSQNTTNNTSRDLVAWEYDCFLPKLQINMSVAA